MKRNLILSVLVLVPPKVAAVGLVVYLLFLAAEHVLVEALKPALSEVGVFA